MIIDEMIVNRRLMSVMAWDLCTTLRLRSSSALMDVPLLFWGLCVESFEPTVCLILFTLRKKNGLYANISKNIHTHNALMIPRHKKRLRKYFVLY